MSKNISAVVPDETYQAFDLLAENMGVSRSKAISLILSQTTPSVLKLAKALHEADKLKNGSMDYFLASMHMNMHSLEGDIRQMELEVASGSGR